MIQANQISSRPPVSLAFASIGAISQESRIDAWAKIESAQSSEEMLNTLQEILYRLKIPMKKSGIEWNVNESRIQYQCTHSQIQYHVSLQSDSKEVTTTAKITIISRHPEANLNQLSEALATMHAWSWEKSYRYTGLLDANTDSDGRMEIMRVLSQNLKMDPLEYYTDEKRIRCTGYSPLVSSQRLDFIAAYGETNIQTLIRERQDKKSEIYIGIPSLFNKLD